MKHVVAVRRYDQLFDRQTHLLRQITRKNIAEVASGHRKTRRPINAAKGQRRIKVIDNLRHDARPVDRVDRHQPATIRQEGLGHKARFHHRLAVVEVTLNRDVMNIGRHDGCHLTTLDLRDTLMRMQNENIDIVAALAALDSGASRIARCRTHNHDFFAASS